MRSGKNLVLFCLTYFCYCHITFAQDTPYYQLPQNRAKNHEKVVMPNLDAFGITYFITASGGVRKPFMSENQTSPSAVTSGVQSTGFWEVTVGQNRNDNWIYEFGITQYKGYLRTSFDELGRFPLVFTNDIKQYYMPLRVKKRVWTIDRVSRNAFLNLGFGGSYLLIKQKNLTESGSFLFQQRLIPEANDYTSLDYSLSSSKFPLMLEFMMELRGKVSERLEIGLFAKTLLRNSEHLSNSFNFNYVDGRNIGFDTSEKAISLAFGIQAKFNSPKYFSYKSKVE